MLSPELTHDHIIAILLGMLSVLLGAVITILIAGYKMLAAKVDSGAESVRLLKVYIHNFMISQFLLMQKLHPHQAELINESMQSWLTDNGDICSLDKPNHKCRKEVSQAND